MARPNLRNKVTKKVNSEFGPQAAAVGKAQGKRRKQFVKERDSLKGAVGAAQAATAATKLGGIKGPEGRQVRAEVIGRQKSLANALPGLLAPVQSEFKADRSALREEAAGIEQDRQATIAEELASKIAAVKENKQKTNFALREAIRLVHTDGEGNKLDVPDLPSTPEEWTQFSDALSNSEGVEAKAAIAATRRLQKKATRARFRMGDFRAGGW